MIREVPMIEVREHGRFQGLAIQCREKIAAFSGWSSQRACIGRGFLVVNSDGTLDIRPYVYAESNKP